MSYPASIETLRRAFDGANGFSLTAKNKAQGLRTRSVSGPVERRLFLDLQQTLAQAITWWDRAKALPGMQAYARDQFQNQTLDVAAEFVAMTVAAASLRDWIFAVFPTDAASGAVLEKAVDINGTVTDLTFTSLQLAAFRTEADAFLATVS